MSECVHPILAKNSSRIGTALLLGLLSLLERFWQEELWAALPLLAPGVPEVWYPGSCGQLFRPLLLTA